MTNSYIKLYIFLRQAQPADNLPPQPGETKPQPHERESMLQGKKKPNKINTKSERLQNKSCSDQLALVLSSVRGKAVG